MISQETEHKNAGRFAFYAARDASMNHAINASRFTDAQKLKAERVKLALEMVYSADDFSITNNKTFIRVKVHNGIVRNKKMLVLFEADWAKDGISRKLTKQGIIYCVK